MRRLLIISTFLGVLALGAASTCGARQDEVLLNGGFESGSTEWIPVGPVTIESTSDPVHEGCCSVRVGGRTSSWNGVGQMITERLESDRSYAVSGWVRLEGGASDDVSIKYRKIDESGTEWILLAQVAGKAFKLADFVWTCNILLVT